MPVPVLTASRVVPAPPAAAFELLVRTRSWPRWGPSVAAVEPADARIGLGTSGRVRTAVGVWLPFEVTAFDEGRSWSWRVAGVPATGHRVELADGGCRLCLDVPIVAAPYLAVCHLALRRLARLLEDDAAS